MFKFLTFFTYFLAYVDIVNAWVVVMDVAGFEMLVSISVLAVTSYSMEFDVILGC